MSATYSAGDARLQIIPDASNFRKKLEAEMRRINAELPVDVSTRRATQQIDRFRAEQSRRDVNIKVDADTKAAQLKIAALREELDRFSASSMGAGSSLSSVFSAGGIIGLTAFNPAVLGGLASVAQGLQQVAQAGLALPGVIGGAAASIGTLKLGMSGMSDALDAVAKSSDGSAKNMQAANEALAKLNPNAAAVVKTIGELTPVFDDLKKQISGELFSGMSEQIKHLADADLPILRSGMTKIAQGWNADFKALTASLSDGQTQGILDRLLGNTADAQQRFAHAIDPIVKGIGTLVAGSSDALPRLADGLGSVATRFANFIESADKDGRLQKWINDGIDGVASLGESVLNIGKAFTAITGASGGGFLQWLKEATGNLQAFLNSDAGQSKLKAMFEAGREELHKIVDIIKNLGPPLGAMFMAAQDSLNVFLPPLQLVSKVLSEFPGLIYAVTAGFIAWKTIDAINTLRDRLTPLGTAIKGAATHTRDAGLAFGTMTSYLQQANPEMSKTEARMAAMKAGASELSGHLGGIKGVASGVVGMLGGPLGIALMAGTTAFEMIASKNAAASAAMDGYKTAVKASADAQMSLNDALLQSNGLMDAAAKAEANKKVQAAKGELEAGSKSQATFGDNWRNEDGSLRLIGAGDAGSLIKIKQARAEIQQRAVDAIDKLKLSEANLAAQVTGDQPTFDALVASLQKQGDGGVVAAEKFKQTREQILGAQEAGATAGPVLAKLGDDVSQSAADIKTAFSALPTNVPINVSAPGGEPVYDLLKKLGVAVNQDNDKNITVEAPLAPEVLKALEALGIKVNTDNDKHIIVTQSGAEQASAEIDQAARDREAIIRVLADTAAAGINAGAALGVPTRAAGGPISGPGSGTSDSILARLSNGEFVVNAKATAQHRELLEHINAPGYAGGGLVTPNDNPVTPGMAPGPSTPAPLQAGMGNMAQAALGGLGNLGPIGNFVNMLNAPAPDPSQQTVSQQMGITGQTQFGTPEGNFMSAASTIPGIWGLAAGLASPDPAGATMNWGTQTVGWLSNFASGTVSSLGSALLNGALGAVGLQQSILSPSNPWTGAALQGANFFLGGSGPLGAMGSGGGGGGAGGGTSLAGSLSGSGGGGGGGLSSLLGTGSAGDLGGSFGADGKSLSLDWKTIDALAAQKGLTMTSGYRGANGPTIAGVAAAKSYHASGRAHDYSNGTRTPQELAFAMFMAQNYGPKLKELIYDDPRFSATIHDGKVVGPFGGFYTMGQAGDHTNHVHVAFGAGGAVSGPGGPKSDSIPAWLSNDEHVLTAADVTAMGGHDNVMAFRNALHRADGGPILLQTMIPQADPSKAIPKPPPVIPPPGGPNAVTPIGEPPPPPGAPPAADDGQPTGDQPGAAPLPAPVEPPPQAPLPDQNADTPTPEDIQRAAEKAPEAGGAGMGAAPTNRDHTLPALNSAVMGGAQAIGSLITTAVAAAAAGGTMGAGAPAAGMAAPLIQGGIQQGAKVLTSGINVLSSFLVGNIPGSYGAADDATGYGQLVRAQQRDPVTAPAPRVQNNTFNGMDVPRVFQELDLRDAQHKQAALAGYRG